MPIYRITAPLIEYCKKLQNVKITIRNAQVVGSSPIPSSKNLTIYPKTDVRGNTEFRLKQSFYGLFKPFSLYAMLLREL